MGMMERGSDGSFFNEEGMHRQWIGFLMIKNLHIVGGCEAAFAWACCELWISVLQEESTHFKTIAYLFPSFHAFKAKDVV